MNVINNDIESIEMTLKAVYNTVKPWPGDIAYTPSFECMCELGELYESGMLSIADQKGCDNLYVLKIVNPKLTDICATAKRGLAWISINIIPDETPRPVDYSWTWEE